MMDWHVPSPIAKGASRETSQAEEDLTCQAATQAQGFEPAYDISSAARLARTKPLHDFAKYLVDKDPQPVPQTIDVKGLARSSKSDQRDARKQLADNPRGTSSYAGIPSLALDAPNYTQDNPHTAGMGTHHKTARTLKGQRARGGTHATD